jgi:molybdopterin-containing oxidoreductase family membrane subunit
MVASLDLLFAVDIFRGTGRYALWVSLVTLPAALMLIGLDLGHMERIWKVYVQPNPTSLLAQLVWTYSALLVTAALAFVLSMQGKRSTLKPVMAIGLVLALFVSGGVGALLGVNAGQSSFHNAMLPAQFPVLNLASGVAVLLTIVGLFAIVAGNRGAALLRVLGVALVVLLLAKAYFMWVDYSQVLYSGVPDAVAVAELILFGPYWWAFWILQLLLGIIVPIIILLGPARYRPPIVAGIAGILVLVGLAVGRTAIIFPALSIPDLEGLAEAFHGPHLNYDYVPSLMEWSVTIGVVGLATLAYLIGTDRLPYLRRSGGAAS